LILKAEIYRTLNFLNVYPVFKSFLKEIKPVNFMIIVFGSFAEFKATESSDLDILVVSDKEIELPFHLVPYELHKIDLSENEFFNALKEGETLIREIISNHIILCNHSYFVDLIWWYYGKKT